MRHEVPGLLRLDAPDEWTSAPPDDHRVALLLVLPDGQGILEVLGLPGEALGELSTGQAFQALLGRAPDAAPEPLTLPAGPAALARVTHLAPAPALQLVVLVAGGAHGVLLSLTCDPDAAGALEAQLRGVASSLALLRAPDPALTERARAALQARWPGWEVQPLAALLLRVRAPGGEHEGELSLVALSEELSALPAEREPAHLERFAAAAPLQQLRDPALAGSSARVYPALLPPEARSAVARALPSGLRVTLIDDARLVRRELDLVDLVERGWSWDEAYARACAALEAHLSRVPMEGSEDPQGRPALLTIAGTPHAAAALALPGFTQRAAETLGDPCLACAPARDALIAWRLGDPALDAHARGTAARLHKESAAPLPPIVWRVSGERLTREGRILM